MGTSWLASMLPTVLCLKQIWLLLLLLLRLLLLLLPVKLCPQYM